SAIKDYRELLLECMSGGAQQIRVAGEIPRPGIDLSWEWWARYEATLNHVFDGFPVRVLCTYDTRVTSVDVLADAVRTHPHLVANDGRRIPNDRFEDPASFLIRSPASGADPLEATPPTIDLIHPTPVAARHAVVAASRTSYLDQLKVADMVFTV